MKCPNAHCPGTIPPDRHDCRVCGHASAPTAKQLVMFAVAILAAIVVCVMI